MNHAMKIVSSVLISAFVSTSLSHAQAPAQKPQFEVASVKPHVQGTGPALGGVMEMPPSGRVNIVNATLRQMLLASYRLQDYQIIGGPDWLNSDRFDIQAKPSPDYQPESVSCIRPDCPPTRVYIMMQELLVDRFQLKTHREMRELPTYELMPVKSGFKLKEVPPSPPREPNADRPTLPPQPPPGTGPPASASAVPTPPPGVSMSFGTGFAASAVQFGTLTSILSGILGRAVIDETGIHGNYNFKLVFSRDGLPGGPAPRAVIGAPTLTASDPRPTIFTALQEEFGLKLESSKGPVEVLVIDSVQKPSEN
jgi:uncharacterized protein (TIGR03435 family)